MLRRLRAHPNPSEVHFYSSSGGNAGLACVHAARALSCPATVVVPQSTAPRMIAMLRAAGAAAVLQHGATWREADAFLRAKLAAASGPAANGVYVPPFDDPDIWAGHATVVDEVVQQLQGEKPDAVVCSVGGGGLFCGIMEGLDRHGWSDVPVLAMETRGAESLNASLRAGELVTLAGITSQAKSLGATRVARQAFEYGRRPNVRSAVLDDAEAAMGCWRLADDERIMVELACGVNVALCFDGRLGKVLGVPLQHDSKVVIILCGGSNVTIDMLAGWRKEFGHIEEELPTNCAVSSTYSAPKGARA